MTTCNNELTDLTDVTYVEYDLSNDYMDQFGLPLSRAREVLYDGSILTVQLDRYNDEEYGIPASLENYRPKSTGVYTYESSTGFRFYDIVSYVLRSYFTEFPTSEEHDNLTLTSFRLYENGVVKPNTDS